MVLAGFATYILVALGIILSPLIWGDKSGNVGTVIWIGLLWPLGLVVLPIGGVIWCFENLGEIYSKAAYNRAVYLENKKSQKIRVAELPKTKPESVEIETPYRDMSCRGCGRSMLNEEGMNERKEAAC